MIEPSEFSSLLKCACDIAQAAGQLINDFTVTRKDASFRVKKDLSPVTDADEAANELITRLLRNLPHKIPIVAEESVAIGDIPNIDNGIFWLVDPLDGTKEFIRGRNDFTVNIALIIDSIPVLGVIYLPSLSTTYWGSSGLGATRQKNGGRPTEISTRRVPAVGATVVTSRSHLTPETEHWLLKQTLARREPVGSSVKFCRIAEGKADLYPRFGPTMEWDVAAGHAILIAAGGKVDTLDGNPLSYGKPDFKNPNFIARGR